VVKPRVWTRPPCKVYTANSEAGSFYYEPMLDYIDRKTLFGADHNLAAMKHNVKTRPEVKMPNACDLAMRSSATTTGPLRLENFLNTYRAKQLKQRNTKTVHVKNEMVRQSRSCETITDKRSCTMVRDRYIDQLSLMYKEGVGQLPSLQE